MDAGGEGGHIKLDYSRDEKLKIHFKNIWLYIFRIKPRSLVTIHHLMCLKLIAILHGARNVIEAFQQTFFTHRMNVEAMRISLRVNHRLRRQINTDS